MNKSLINKIYFVKVDRFKRGKNVFVVIVSHMINNKKCYNQCKNKNVITHLMNLLKGDV